LATITFTVKYPDGTPASGATVKVMDMWETTTYASATTDSSGKCSITLSKGDYLVHAEKEGYSPSYSTYYDFSTDMSVTLWLRELETVTVEIGVEASSTVDSWTRYHGLAIDQELNSDFWISQPEKVITVYPSPISFSEMVRLTVGTHTITYGNSAESDWDAKIYVNKQLIASGKVSRYNFLKATFTVTTAPAPTTPKAKIISYSFPKSPQNAGANLKISFTIQNIGVNGNIYWRLYDTGTKEEFKKWVGTMASGEQKSFEVYITMPKRNLSYLELQAGHVTDNVYYWDDYRYTEILLSTPSPTPKPSIASYIISLASIILGTISSYIMRRR
jgi:hypothetical protein